MATKYLDLTGLQSYHTGIKTLLSNKVDKVAGKGLSTNDYTTAEKTKLQDLPSGELLEEILGYKEDKIHKTPVFRATPNDEYYPSEKLVKDNLDLKIDISTKGIANGVASLDSTGKVPSSQLPSFVDDVLEYDTYSSLPVAGETGKIYVTKDTNKTYRWSGSAYAEISASLALGETSSTAYRGDRGKAAYDHSQVAHAPSNAERNIITGVKKNGTTVTPVDRVVNITVPTTPGEVGAAAASHNHAISDITNLTTTLAGKASSTHTHAIIGSTTDGYLTVENNLPIFETTSSTQKVLLTQDDLSPISGTEITNILNS